MNRKDTSDKKKRLHELRKLVNYHRQLYHELDSPEISDQAYDALLQELIDLENSIGGGLSQVAQAVGGKPSEAFKKVQHQEPQWSFDNLFMYEELVRWRDRCYRLLSEADYVFDNLSYVVEHKIDGLKLVVYYKEGFLYKALTRGDGKVGEDVTHTARTIANLPHTLTSPVDLICVGEVWMGAEEFNKINELRKKNSEDPFANPRNASAGTIRQLDPTIASEREISYTAYDIDSCDLRNSQLETPKTQWEELELLRVLGLPCNENSLVMDTIEEIQNYYEKWVVDHHKLPYGVDGVVIKVNSIIYQRALGYTAKAPRFGIAYKFPAEQSTTVVEDVVLQVGRTGVVTPVAKVRPTLIDGSTVSRATLHNEDFIKDKDIRIGDTVIIQKAGDIIPEIVSVISELRPKNAKKFTFPDCVSDCGGDGSIQRREGESAYRCLSLDSTYIKRLRMYHLVSRDALNIDGIGPKVIDALFSSGKLSQPADLFRLTKEDFLNLPLFKEKSASNAIESIEKARTVTFDRFLYGLGIDNVGAQTARDLVDTFSTIQTLQKASLDEISRVYGIGDTVARSLLDWFSHKENQKQLQELLKVLHITEPSLDNSVKESLKGLSFVITGSLDRYSRDEVKQMIRRLGGSVKSSVSSKTSYVIVGKDPGSKLEQAQKMGVNILHEEEFIALLNGE